jgi:hypothetical protein
LGSSAAVGEGSGLGQAPLLFSEALGVRSVRDTGLKRYYRQVQIFGELASVNPARVGRLQTYAVEDDRFANTM